MSKWIWRFGDFEFYHNMKVHSKRQSYGYVEAPVWKVCPPEVTVAFSKSFESPGGKLFIYACGDFSTAIIDEYGNRTTEYRGMPVVELPAGQITLEIRVISTKTFPAIYTEGAVETDESWLTDDMSLDYEKAAAWEVFDAPDKRPDVFPFSYKAEHYVKKEEAGDGVLFDFGRELFAGVRLSGLDDAATTRVQFGESAEEACDPDWSVIHFDIKSEVGEYEFIPYAFRYIYVSDKNADIEAASEYLPYEKCGAFTSEDELINRIWQVSKETFLLNSREFFLDGIKRDRWVWSADTYQSLFVNRYLYNDPEIEKRTLIALGGKKPFKRHINTIVDYTFFWIMSIHEHYMTYGDKDFVERLWPQMDEVLSFCEGLTDGDGFIRGRKRDWIFIDWADIDKTGAVLGVQILYAKALLDYAALCSVLAVDDGGRKERAQRLFGEIERLYWDEGKKAFVDSFESEKHHISRQSNIFAYLFLPLSDEKKELIYKSVIDNDKVAPITTPYFTFYENQVHCMAGNDKSLEAKLRDYYGGMLSLGATTLFEQYDPKDEGAEHYAMYGRPFEKSLCHAWSASPIYLMGAFRLGVKNTGVAYSAYEVRPNPGELGRISGEVLVPGGVIRVWADGERAGVCSDIPGGKLFWKGKEYEIKVHKETVTE